MADRLVFGPFAGASVEQQCKLVDLLRSHGGKRLGDGYDATIDRLIEDGRVFQDRARLEPGTPHACHHNTVWLFLNNRERIQIATGYGLYRGTWWRHSWGYDTDSNARHRIIETTVHYTKYFGILLDFKEAIAFAMMEG